MTDQSWRADPVIAQVDADAQEEFNTEWAALLGKHVARPEHLQILRELYLVAYSSGFTKGLDSGLRLGGVRLGDDFPPPDPDGDRGNEGDEDRLEGGGDNGDGPE